MNKLDKDYIELIKDVLDNGTISKDRTGTGTKKTFVNVIKHDMRDGFPLLTSKYVYHKGVFSELLWFLSGGENIRPMVLDNVNIWVGDAYKRFITKTNNVEITQDKFIELIKTDESFAEKWGHLGPVYGSLWRNFNGIDQLEEVIKSLKENPKSRRHIVTAWKPDSLKDQLLPPCHNMFQFQVEEIDDKQYLNLVFNMRSVDVGLGLPFDIASYGALLQIIAKEVKMIPKTLACTLVDTHIYLDQIEPIQEIFKRELHKLPTLELPDKHYGELVLSDFVVKDYKHSGSLKLPLSN